MVEVSNLIPFTRNLRWKHYEGIWRYPNLLDYAMRRVINEVGRDEKEMKCIVCEVNLEE